MSVGRTITIWGAALLVTGVHCKDEGGADGGSSGGEESGSATAMASADETAGDACGNGVMDGFEVCDDGNDINGDGCNADCTITKTMEWSQVWDGGAGADCALGVAVDSGGNVIAAGYADSGSTAGTDIWIRKHDPTGAETWISLVNGPASGEDFARAVAVGPDDTIVVAGFVTGDAVSGREIWVRKLDPSGNEVWTDTVAGPFETGDDSAYAVTVLDDGSVIVGGELTITDQDNDLWVRKYDPGGNEQWTYTHAGDGLALDSARGLSGTADGDVYVTGWDTASDGGRRIWTAKLAGANGAETWAQTYTGGAVNGNTGFGVGTLSDSSLAVTGQQRTGSSTVDAWTRSYDANGGEGWTDVFSGLTGGADIGHGIGIGSDDTVTIVGTFLNSGDTTNIFVRKLDASGSEQWTEAIAGDTKSEADGWAVAIDPTNDHIVVAGCQAEPGDIASGDVYILKYTP